MDDITLNLLVFAIFLLLAGIVFFVIRKKQKQEEEKILLFVKEKGWNFETIKEPLVKGFRIKSPSWTLEAISRSEGRESGPGSIEMEQKTIWFAEKPGSTILIGPKTTQVNLGPAVELLKAQIIQKALGKDAAGIKEVQIGSSSFQKQYLVWAQNIDAADKLLSPALQSALLSWTSVIPLIKRTSAGISIELKSVHLKKAEEIEKLVHLGERFL